MEIVSEGNELRIKVDQESNAILLENAGGRMIMINLTSLATPQGMTKTPILKPGETLKLSFNTVVN